MTTLSALNEMAQRVAVVNKQNGWFDDDRTVLDECMLLVTEVAEMAEAFRDGEMDPTTREDGKPEGFPSECADVLIRLLDTCYRHGIDLDDEFERKLTYNASRGYRHGGKTL